MGLEGHQGLPAPQKDAAGWTVFNPVQKSPHVISLGRPSEERPLLAM